MSAMDSAGTPHWADVLTLRDEVRATDGSVGELQMSLSKAVYQTVPVPYAKCEYFTDITEPTPKLVGFLARVARRLGVERPDAHACFHLDQGMGGGKSHALVGLWHMITRPDTFFESDLGRAVAAELGANDGSLNLVEVIPVVLTCDGFSPGKTDARFGPARDLFGRFLWSLFAMRQDQMDRFQHYIDQGPNKATLQAAFAEVQRPVLVLIDELMDYVMALTDQSQIGGMPGEQAFLNALTDAVDDQPGVALVLVMIRSEEDQAGYHPQAEAFRDYLTPRLQRNGETVTVTEPADFAQIIRRRLFEGVSVEDAAKVVGLVLSSAANDEAWSENVFSALGTARGSASLPTRVAETYPFHPDLFALISKEWAVVQAFQRVRSTVSIFARTALHWVSEHQSGRWAPLLIGPGDLPLQTDALEALLSSGVLAGNDRAIQGYRAVANGDVINTGGGGGTAFALDRRLADQGLDVRQPQAAVRMATACFAYSLVPRPRGPRGATKPELLAAILVPQLPYATAEEVFNALIAPPSDGGLGALERRRSSGKGPDYFYLSIKQTLTMYHSNALTMVSMDQSAEQVWTTAQALADKGAFGAIHKLTAPTDTTTRSASVFEGLDSQQTRLVVLDPRRWTLLNGKDASTREDLDVLFGVVSKLASQYAASLVVAVANSQRRDRARGFAREFLAWEHVVAQLDGQDEEYQAAVERRTEAKAKLEDAVRKAYQHYAYVLRTSGGLAVQYKQVPESQTSLSGANVWAALVAESRAVALGQLSASYIGQLVASFDRDLTPKELFSQPYTNPMWPLIASDEEDMRRVLFELATSPEWMLVDSEGGEIRPESPGQIQPATLQQKLQRRSISSAPVDTGAGKGEDGVDLVNGEPTAGGAEVHGLPGLGGAQDMTYDRTKIVLDYSSMTDPDRRGLAWQLLRELASLLDQARQKDIQMFGLVVDISARTGDVSDVLTKAEGIEGVRTETTSDDL